MKAKDCMVCGKAIEGRSMSEEISETAAGHWEYDLNKIPFECRLMLLFREKKNKNLFVQASNFYPELRDLFASDLIAFARINFPDESTLP